MTFLFGKTSRVSFSFFHSSLVIPRFFTCLVRIGSQKCSFSLHSTFYRVAGCWHAGFLFFAEPLGEKWAAEICLRWIKAELTEAELCPAPSKAGILQGAAVSKKQESTGPGGEAERSWCSRCLFLCHGLRCDSRHPLALTSIPLDGRCGSRWRGR